MREPIKPKVPDKYVDEYIYSRYSDSIGTFSDVISDIEDQLIHKGYARNEPLDLSKIKFEFDHCSSYSSCTFMYCLEEQKPKEIYEKELKRYESTMKLYNKEQKKYNDWKKSKLENKLQERKKLYEKLKKEFEDV